MSLLRTITQAGVPYTETAAEKRDIVLTNYISLIAAGATLMLLVGRFFFAHVNILMVFTLLQGTLLFLLPIVLNRFGFINVSRLFLCWVPSIFQLYGSVQTMYDITTYEASIYVGLRFFLLAFGCFPFLVFNMENKVLFISGLLGPMLCILLFDPVLDFFGVGFSQVGLRDTTYDFNNVRTFIAFVIIGSSCYLLKNLVEKNAKLNEQLIEELDQKNWIIQAQAHDEVHKANVKLQANIEQLREREFILNQSQRIAKVGSWEYRPENKSQFWSDELYNIFGLDKSFDLTDPNLAELLWGRQSEIVVNANRNLLKTGQPYDLTLSTKTPLGYSKWIRIHAFPIYRDKTIIGATGICHDITIYKEAEERITANEQKYRLLFEQASVAILVTDFKGNLTDVNPAVCKMFGYSREELLHLNVSALVDSESLKARPIPFEALKAGDHIFSERLMVHKDGTRIDVEANVKKSGEDRIMAIVHDVTELRRIQKQVQISEARFRGAFEYSATGMALVSLEGKWLKVNKGLCNITGYSESELLASTFQQITHPDDLKRDLEILQEAPKGELKSFEVEKRYVHKNGSVVWVNLNVSVIKDNDEQPLYFVAQIEDIGERKKAEEDKERARYALNERIKELTTLYHTSQILHAEHKPIPTVLQEIVSILPAGWQYPEITEARIVLDGTEFTTPNYKSSPYKQIAEFQTPEGATGLIEVIYLEEKPEDAEGPFLAEERNLINMLAEMIRIYLTRNLGEEALKKSEANLNATINNTEIMIWSVDREFNLITFNRPFSEYVKNQYGIEIKPGKRIMDSITTEEGIEMRQKWKEIYMRALSGEIVSLEETRFGRDFKYSISPIIENTKVIGVSVFADNVTERKARDRELSEANKKIGELKLMALRSVMNPHFVFNVLNSIQFFIARNDRLNAINYLSTFSKLIRSILTHSVNNKIKLMDEIEMLKNYIQLEMTRFEDKFNFVLHVDDDVEVDSIEIPSLLIQPYVENAILHGLYNKKDQGTLTISVREKDDAVVFEIEDDGIGREAAKKLRQQNFPTHKSMGIKLTEERLKLINERHNVAFEIQDLENDKGPCGTKVIIWVKV